MQSKRYNRRGYKSDRWRTIAPVAPRLWLFSVSVFGQRDSAVLFCFFRYYASQIPVAQLLHSLTP